MKTNIAQSKSRWRCAAHANPVTTSSTSHPAAYRAFRRPLRFLAALMASFMLLVAAACGDDGEESTEESTNEDASLPVIVATTDIWADVVSNLACDGLATIENIIPSGSDPHGFEPSLADRERMENADLVVANGLDLEESLLVTIEASEDSGVPVFELADHIDLIDFVFEVEDDHDEEESESSDSEEEESEDHGEEDGEEEEEHHHEPSGSDPHVWFDPVRVSSALPDLAERLVADAGLDETAVDECLDAYQAELVALNNEIEQMLEQVPNANRKLVTNHDSLGYYANRYGFSVVASIIPGTTTMAETNPARLEELAETIEETGVKAIFAETMLATGDADALASEVGDIKVVSLFTGSLGPEGSGAETYIGFLRTNTERIVEALS
ncbi:MAG: metal ABC transporter substrate-binding protein [Acidimicrobiaceae bacterium]|nr:metal ABC transporter substrate-binding protein [Acidimicrobiaceae bacterium]